MKTEKVCLLIGGIVAVATIALLIFFVVQPYTIVNIVCAELLATFTVSRILTLQNVERTFLVPSTIIVSIVMVVAMAVVSLGGYLSIPFIIMIYACALILYTVILYFAKRIYLKSVKLNQAIHQSQICLDVLQSLKVLPLDVQITDKIVKLQEDIRLLDVSREFDLTALVNALLYFQKHYQDEGFEIIKEFNRIEIQIEQYHLLSKQSQYGKVS